MGGNTFGDQLSVTASGYSHGKEGIVGILDGFPPGIEVDAARDIQPQMERRRPGQSRLTTSRNEADHVEILTGTVLKPGNIQVTDGTSIEYHIANTHARSKDYENLKHVARPGHANLTYIMRNGEFQHEGSGAASARLTAIPTAAGAFCEKALKLKYPKLEIVAYVKTVGDIESSMYDKSIVTRDAVDRWVEGKNKDGSVELDKLGNPAMYNVRCPDYLAADKMIDLIKEVRDDGDTIGGVIECVVRGMPQGLGDPLYSKLKGKLADGMMQIPASLGFELGAGLAGTRMRGSEFNDAIFRDEAKSPIPVSTRTNNAGGINGGISNGMPIEFRVAFKPAATLLGNHVQETVDLETFENTIIGNTKGRHDPCVVPRAVAIVESFVALIIMNQVIKQYGTANWTTNS